jgi:hypothetical protein
MRGLCTARGGSRAAVVSLRHYIPSFCQRRESALSGREIVHHRADAEPPGFNQRLPTDMAEGQA